MEPSTPSDKNNLQPTSVDKNVSTNKAFEPISFFNKDKSFVFAHQKIKKLVAAVYMLTNFLPHDEPIKWSLRRLGTGLLRLNIDLKDTHSTEQYSIESSLQENILEITSLLEVASFAGMISEMNIAVIKREFHSLLSHVHKTLRDKMEGDPLLKSPFFHDEIETNVSNEYEESFDGKKKHMSSIPHGSRGPIETEDAHRIKDKINSNPGMSSAKEVTSDEVLATPQVNGKKLKEFGPVAVKKNKRQSIIINLLKRKKDIMVKDVADVVQDCSEKTLQRELLALVSQGILRKEGERRWTRYSLVS